MKVYVVETGAYSDHSFHSIHSTRDRAEAVADRLNRYLEPSVTEWDVDDYQLPQVPPGMTAYLVIFDQIGVAQCFPCNELDDHEKAAQQEQGINYLGEYTIYVFARDEAHAIKIAADRRSRWQAEREGIT